MTPLRRSPPRPDHRHAIGLAALLGIAALLLAMADPASSGSKRSRASLLAAHLEPLSGQSERGTLHMTVRGQQLSIIAVLVALKTDSAAPANGSSRALPSQHSHDTLGSSGFVGTETFTYTLRLSRRTCDQFPRGMRRPLFVGPSLNKIVGDFDGDGRNDIATLYGTGKTFPRIKYARSVVLYAEQDGASSRSVRACGRLQKLRL